MTSPSDDDDALSDALAASEDIGKQLAGTLAALNEFTDALIAALGDDPVGRDA